LIRVMKKATIIALIVLMFPVLGLAGNSKAYAAENSLKLDVAAAILIDAKTGKVLYEQNADEMLAVASMSKMLTEYLVLEAIHEGKITWDQEVIISEFIHKLSSPNLNVSTVGLTQGEAYTVKELYESMAIHSANASTVALAELIAGTEEKFVEMMKEKAEELGLEDFHLVNSTGLNNSDMLGNHPEGTDVNDENKMTARAVAKLAYHLIKDYPEVLDTASVPELHFRDGRVYYNFNWMLPGLVHEYKGVDGLKTGSTELAGYNFTGTVERNGQRFITVVMKAKSQSHRFEETRKLMDYAFNNFSEQEIFPANSMIEEMDTVPVLKGKKDSVKIKTKDPLRLVIKNGDEESYKPKLVLNKDLLNDKGELVAPVKEGTAIGYLTYEYVGDEKDYGFIEPDKLTKVDVIASETVEKANWFVLMLRGIGGFFTNLWNSIVTTVTGWF